jgi:ribosomal protein L13E
MGEFHDAVSTLLEAFSCGIAIIKSQRGRRKREQLPLDSTKKIAETHLSKSLKKNRTDVKNAYGRDVSRYGQGFAVGDGKAFLASAL